MVAPSDIFRQLNELVSSLKSQGILDSIYSLVMEIGHQGQNYVLLSQINDAYIQDAQKAITEICDQLSEPVIEYEQVNESASSFKARTMGLGGKRLAIACYELQNGCDESDEEEAFAAYEKIEREFEILKDSLNRISDLAKSVGGD